jgi:hypothetical protein
MHDALEGKSTAKRGKLSVVVCSSVAIPVEHQRRGYEPYERSHQHDGPEDGQLESPTSLRY